MKYFDLTALLTPVANNVRKNTREVMKIAGEASLNLSRLVQFNDESKINLAIKGRDSEGWYSIGKIEIK